MDHWFCSVTKEMRCSTMRLHLLLQVFILQCLLKLAHGQITSCDTAIMVHRHTVYYASSGETLTIKCPVRLCRTSLPLISWIKHVDGRYNPVNTSHRVHTKQNMFNPLSGEGSLIFRDVQTGDSGSYQCQVGGIQSHSIYVNVSDHAVPSTATTENVTASQEAKEGGHISVYLYFLLGLLVSVIILMSLIVSFKKVCEGERFFRWGHSDGGRRSLLNSNSLFRLHLAAEEVKWTIYRRCFWSGAEETRRSTMRLHLLLRVFLLQRLLKLAHGQITSCDTAIMVHRNTVYYASSGEALTISCPVRLCNTSLPLISWIKHVDGRNNPVNTSHRVHTKQNMSNPLSGEGSLIFRDVQTGDSGSYQCQVGGIQSHGIYVNVSENVGSSNTSHENRTASGDKSEYRNVRLYVYVSAGILGLVIFIIILTVLSLKFCKGTSRKETPAENEILMVPVVRHMRGSQDPGPTARLSVRKKTPLSQPANSNAVSTSQQEEEGCVEYAALNHMQVPSATPRQPRLDQESTEYAAIRVR
ncbi:uncharacterized protein LOC128767998 [Synchiropus splendidus]|uniref:uncharacterized protein LOC128767998 n=1 Tax=Synchiropus splendidus TaxID=270530 RepID=UPI00237D33A0|nr:uncharacterized protein LOC128767998 [Synchiropus splendidus]